MITKEDLDYLKAQKRTEHTKRDKGLKPYLLLAIGWILTLGVVIGHLIF